MEDSSHGSEGRRRDRFYLAGFRAASRAIHSAVDQAIHQPGSNSRINSEPSNAQNGARASGHPPLDDICALSAGPSSTTFHGVDSALLTAAALRPSSAAALVAPTGAAPSVAAPPAPPPSHPWRAADSGVTRPASVGLGLAAAGAEPSDVMRLSSINITSGPEVNGGGRTAACSSARHAGEHKHCAAATEHVCSQNHPEQQHQAKEEKQQQHLQAPDKGSQDGCYGARGWWANYQQRLKLSSKVFSDIVRRKPWVLAAPLLLCCLLCGLGVFGVVFAARRHVAATKEYAQAALASTTVSAISGQLEIATFAIMTVSAYITQQPWCASLNQAFGGLSGVITQWDDKGLVYQVQALPAAVLNYIYPPVTGDLAKMLIGRDLLRVPMYRNDTLYQIRTRNQRLLLGPYNLLEGFQGMFVTYPIFLPAPDASYDWGCGVQPYECPPDVCWLPAEGLKLWGLATSVISLDNMQEDFRFEVLRGNGYLYRLRQLPDASNGAAVISSSDQLPRDPVTASIHKFNLVWVLEVAPEGGWAPRWRDPCIAAVVVGSCLVCGLVLWLLVTREKHTMLLRAMLPRKVIHRLQRGEQTVVEEFPEPVTILFSDIVSYTEVASQLTPLQVVRLLNDLYTEFDTLTDKHGVYKVETIGDAFMCVSGCPIREDPVAAAVRMAGMAADMVACVQRFRSAVGAEELAVKIRIGLHSGPVVAGVIGQRMPRYCLFGDTVNTASRMETNSAPMCIHVSDTTAELLRRGGAAVVPHPATPAPASLLPTPRPSALGTQRPAAQVQPQPQPQPLSPAEMGVQAAGLNPERYQKAQGAMPAFAQAHAQPGPAAGVGKAGEQPAQSGARHGAEGQGQQQGVVQQGALAAGKQGPPGPGCHLVVHSRGRIMIKGKGIMNTYWLQAGAAHPPAPPPPQPPTAAAAAAAALLGHTTSPGAARGSCVRASAAIGLAPRRATTGLDLLVAMPPLRRPTAATLISRHSHASSRVARSGPSTNSSLQMRHSDVIVQLGGPVCSLSTAPLPKVEAPTGAGSGVRPIPIPCGIGMGLTPLPSEEHVESITHSGTFRSSGVRGALGMQIESSGGASGYADRALAALLSRAAAGQSVDSDGSVTHEAADIAFALGLWSRRGPAEGAGVGREIGEQLAPGAAAQACQAAASDVDLDVSFAPGRSGAAVACASSGQQAASAAAAATAAAGEAAASLPAADTADGGGMKGNPRGGTSGVTQGAGGQRRPSQLFGFPQMAAPCVALQQHGQQDGTWHDGTWVPRAWGVEEAMAEEEEVEAETPGTWDLCGGRLSVVGGGSQERACRTWILAAESGVLGGEEVGKHAV